MFHATGLASCVQWCGGPRACTPSRSSADLSAPLRVCPAVSRVATADRVRRPPKPICCDRGPTDSQTARILNITVDRFNTVSIFRSKKNTVSILEHIILIFSFYVREKEGQKSTCILFIHLTRRIARVFARLVLKIQKFACRCILT